MPHTCTYRSAMVAELKVPYNEAENNLITLAKVVEYGKVMKFGCNIPLMIKSFHVKFIAIANSYLPQQH